MDEENKEIKQEVEEQKAPKAQRNRKTIYLVIFLAVVAIGLIYVAISNKGLNPPASISDKQEFLSFAHTTLSLNPPVTVISAPDEVGIQIDTGDNKITGIELQMSYDPNFLQDVDIKEGEFLVKPVILIKKVDSQKGAITFTLGAAPGQEGISGKGNIAIISFNPKPNVIGKTTINFLPQTVVTAQGISESVLKEAFGNSFTVSSIEAR